MRVILNELKNAIVTNTVSAESLLLSKTYVTKHANKIILDPTKNIDKLIAFNRQA